MELKSKDLKSAVTAFFLVNGKKIDCRLGCAEHLNDRGLIMGYFVRTGTNTIQMINAGSILSVEVTYENVADVDKVFEANNG